MKFLNLLILKNLFKLNIDSGTSGNTIFSHVF